MRHGDISNRSGIAIAIYMKDFLIEVPEPQKFTDKVKDKINPLMRATIDDKVVQAIFSLARNSDCSVVITVDKPYYDRLPSKLKFSLSLLPSPVVIEKSKEDINNKLYRNEYNYLVVKDYTSNIIPFITRQDLCITPEMFFKVARGGYKFV